MLFKFNKSSIVILLISLFSTSSIFSQNLITNGDFESGVGVGFDVNGSGYHLISFPFSGTTSPGDYAFTTNPQPMNIANFIAGGDHTTGTGNMMIVDGNTTGGQQRFWRAGNSGSGVCSLTAGVTYVFSYWIKSVSTTVTSASSSAEIGVAFINGSNIVRTIGSTYASLPVNGWQNVVYTFTATQPCVYIEMFNFNTGPVGNDFAIDDISLVQLTVPFTINYSIVSPTCPNFNDGSIVIYGVGGTPPYTNFTLTGSPNNTNGIFTGLVSGLYNISVTDTAGITVTQNNVIISNPSNILTVSAGTSICSGSSTTLTASGSSAGYTWSASPTDPSLTTPNIANPTVSPTQSTTYTVTSTPTTPFNLVYNGDFFLGNIGFTTDYTYYTPNNPTFTQKAYGVVTNPNSWEVGFSSCVDHTNGLGKMLVVDGSTSNSGNDKLWCQTIPVTAGQTYTFSYWVQTLATPNQANIDVVINGVSQGTSLAPATTCSWVQKSYTWNSGASTIAQICIYDRNVSSAGNDFALDDIYFSKSVTCTLQKTVAITVVSGINLTVTNPPAVCAPATVDITLPAVTAGSTTGTVLTYWTDPAATTSQLTTLAASAIAVGSTYYIKSTLGSCSVIKPVVVTINTATSTPAPVVVSPLYYCQGSTAVPLTATALTGATLNWYGTNATGGTASATAPTPSTATAGTTTYYVSQTVGLCESPRAAIAVIMTVDNGLTIQNFRCDGANSTPTSVAFDWSNVPGHISYNYTYTINSTPPVTGTGNTNLSSAIVPGVLPGQSVTLTITSVVGVPCVPSISNTCSNCTSTTVPVFASIPSSICSGSVAPLLATTSDNGISGTWAPAIVSNTVTGSYVFTPNAILFPCASGTITKGITVASPPTTGTLSGNQNVCVGLTTTFTSTVSGGTWSSSNTSSATVNATTGVVTGILGGSSATITYTVVGTGGCSNVTATRIVTVTAPSNSGVLSGNQSICIGQNTTFSSTIPGGTWTSSSATIASITAAGIITGIAAGTATITYTVAGTGGCPSATVTRTVTVSAPPNAGTITGIQNVCTALTTTFSSTTSGGTWSSGTPAIATVNPSTGVITGVSSGTATITYTVAGTGGCPSAAATRTVTVSNPPVAGTLSGIQSICVGLTTTYSSTVSGGVWSSSNTAIAAVNSVSGVITGIAAGTATLTYTVSGIGGCANAIATRTVTVTAPPSAGTLSGNQAVCIGFSTTFASTVIGGVWSTSNATIATINSASGVIIGVSAGTATMTYLVAGTGGCSSISATRTVTVSAAPNPGILSGTQSICVGQSTTFASTVAGGTWVSSNPAIATINSTTGVINGIAAGSSTITYTVNGTGGCANTFTTRTVTVNANITPTFTPIAAVCSGDPLAPLPLTSLNGITGTWSPALSNTLSQSYTFTPTSGQCAVTATLSITINQRTTPSFALIAPLCKNAPAPLLPSSSSNGITGTWSPPVISTAVVGTTTYVFTPTPGQCVVPGTFNLAVTILPIITPDFLPIAAFCADTTPVPTLSNTSPNGVIGTWSPSVISNTVSGNYVFTPNPNQCAVSQTLSVTVIQKTIPNFAAIPPFCKGSVAPLFTSTSPNGVLGTWSPPTIDNTTSGTFIYAFLPNIGECATTQLLNITVTEPIVPDFSNVAVCSGATPPILYPFSPNGITGSWSPTIVDNLVSADYVFTPNAGECAVPTTIHATVNEYTLVVIESVVTNYFEDNQIVTVLASNVGNYLYQLDYGLFQESNVFENVSAGTHIVTVKDANGCSPSLSDSVLVINYPKFFTPNEDGYNDTWNIFGLKDHTDSSILIYDRYGKLLKNISPNGPGWDGIYNGKPVPSTDYWFTVDYYENQIKKQFKGHFSLKR